MDLLKITCYDDCLYADKYDEETYPMPIYNDVRWEGTLIANEYGGFEGHVKNYGREYFVFGYYIPNKGLMLFEFKDDDFSFNLMNLDPNLDHSLYDNNAEVLNKDYSILSMISSYHEGGYEVNNHIYNQYSGGTESYCRIIIENIRKIEEDEIRNNEEIKRIVNKILKQREKMSARHRNIYLKFSTSLHEFIANKPNSEYVKTLKEDK